MNWWLHQIQDADVENNPLSFALPTIGIRLQTDCSSKFLYCLSYNFNLKSPGNEKNFLRFVDSGSAFGFRM